MFWTTSQPIIILKYLYLLFALYTTSNMYVMYLDHIQLKFPFLLSPESPLRPPLLTFMSSSFFFFFFFLNDTLSLHLHDVRPSSRAWANSWPHPQRKMAPFSCQLSIVNSFSIKNGISWISPTSMPECWLACSYSGLVQITIDDISSWVQWPCRA